MISRLVVVTSLSYAWPLKGYLFAGPFFFWQWTLHYSLSLYGLAFRKFPGYEGRKWRRLYICAIWWIGSFVLYFVCIWHLCLLVMLLSLLSLVFFGLLIRLSKCALESNSVARRIRRWGLCRFARDHQVFPCRGWRDVWHGGLFLVLVYTRHYYSGLQKLKGRVLKLTLPFCGRQNSSCAGFLWTPPPDVIPVQFPLSGPWVGLPLRYCFLKKVL